ncbi:unnamed protein product [Prunus brigantina]
MESKEYSEALSVLSGLITEYLIFFLPLVFFVVSELQHRLPLAFIARKR